MAQKIIASLIDDMDGTEASETVTFGLDGAEYTIDLSEANATHLRSALSGFVEKAARVVKGRKPRAANGARTTVQAGGNREQNHAIREWARAQGKEISDRGRIPVELVQEFQAAHETPASITLTSASTDAADEFNELVNA